MDTLKIKYAKPIEREYEGWIITCIEEYFKKIDKQVRIFAVSPVLESSFPADEVLNYSFKVIGLQFKKASLSPIRNGQANTDYSNLHWVLTNPIGQFALVQKMTEIYYCLPTFINRDYKNVSLDHTLFWRPESFMAAGSYWYGNPNARGVTNKTIEPTTLRWGQFIERVYRCDIGKLQTARQITKDILIDAIINDANKETLEGLYALIIEL